MFKCLTVRKTKANNVSLWKMLISTYIAPWNVMPVDNKNSEESSVNCLNNNANCGVCLTASHPRTDPVKLCLVCKIMIC